MSWILASCLFSAGFLTGAIYGSRRIGAVHVIPAPAPDRDARAREGEARPADRRRSTERATSPSMAWVASN